LARHSFKRWRLLFIFPLESRCILLYSFFPQVPRIRDAPQTKCSSSSEVRSSIGTESALCSSIGTEGACAPRAAKCAPLSAPKVPYAPPSAPEVPALLHRHRRCPTN
jgi:hypothetical protein